MAGGFRRIPRPGLKYKVRFLEIQGLHHACIPSKRQFSKNCVRAGQKLLILLRGDNHATTASDHRIALQPQTDPLLSALERKEHDL
jgi:hypothetical protein